MKNRIILQLTTNHIALFLDAVYVAIVGSLGILVSLLYWELTGNQIISIKLFFIGTLWMIIVILKEVMFLQKRDY